MTKKEEILDSLSKGASFVGKLASKGVGEVSKALKSKEGPSPDYETGMYFQRHLVPQYGRLFPQIEFFEYQIRNKLVMNLLKNITLKSPEKSFVKACQSLFVRDLRGALESLAEASSRDTQFTDAYFLSACLSFSRGDFNGAIENFKKALLLQANLNAHLKKYLPSFRMTLCFSENSTFAFFADLVGLNLLLAIAMRAASRREEGLDVLEQMLGVMPDSVPILFFVAALHIEAGNYDRALEILKDFTAESNLTLSGIVMRAKAAALKGEHAIAVDILRKGQVRGDFDPVLIQDVQYNLGASLLAMGYAREGQEEMNRVLSENPNFSDLLLRIGLEAGMAAAAAAAPTGPDALPQTSPTASIPVATEAPPAAPLQVPVPEAPPKAPQPQADQGPVLHSQDGRVNVVLTKSEYIIGRDEGDIAISWDSSISRRHARVFLQDGAWWVEDLGSTNGTWVNRHRLLKKVMLNRRDLITVGSTNLTLT
jgi:tetratricopeptide (TPR) repeat protein